MNDVSDGDELYDPLASIMSSPETSQPDDEVLDVGRDETNKSPIFPLENKNSAIFTENESNELAAEPIEVEHEDNNSNEINCFTDESVPVAEDVVTDNISVIADDHIGILSGDVSDQNVDEKEENVPEEIATADVEED